MTALDVRDLCVAFGDRPPAVVDVDLQIAEGERVGLIGESGSGKSVTALAVMGLLPEYATVTGEVRLAGQSLLGRTDRQMSALRGHALGMVFQEPMSALDPTMKVGRQMGEVIELHRPKVGRAGRYLEVLDMLDRVGIDDPQRIIGSYPHQLSGGQRQRVVLAMALINSP
ncbi:MAG: ABC transporter ATP-binding protein, partial [Propionibacterium sp.]|nr:ABC transporter ATP-binding protein [Propionibacterium sp.]